MNYYNYPQNYPQYPQQNYQSMQQQAYQQQSQTNGVVLVKNEMDAKNYPVAPGMSVLLRDENSPYIYSKTMGYSQLDRPKFEKYRLVLEESEVKQDITSDNYISVDDFNALSDSFNVLNDDFISLKSELEHLKSELNKSKSSTLKRTPTKKKEGASDDSE